MRSIIKITSKVLIAVISFGVLLSGSCENNTNEILHNDFVKVSFDDNDSVLRIETVNQKKAYTINLDHSGNVNQFSSLLIDEKGNDYLNQWYSFDENGNFYHNSSNYIEAYPYSNNTNYFLNVFYDIPNENETAYILFDPNCSDPFNMESSCIFDTINFIENLSTAMIPLKDFSFGTKTIKFKVIHEKKNNGFNERNIIFATKTFTILKK